MRHIVRQIPKSIWFNHLKPISKQFSSHTILKQYPIENEADAPCSQALSDDSKTKFPLSCDSQQAKLDNDRYARYTKVVESEEVEKVLKEAEATRAKYSVYWANTRLLVHHWTSWKTDYTLVTLDGSKITNRWCDRNCDSKGERHRPNLRDFWDVTFAELLYWAFGIDWWHEIHSLDVTYHPKNSVLKRDVLAFIAEAEHNGR